MIAFLGWSDVNSGWSGVNSTNASTVSNNNGRLKTTATLTYGGNRQVINTQIGKAYTFTFKLDLATTPSVYVNARATNGSSIYTGTNLSQIFINSSGEHTLTFTATTTTTQLLFEKASGTGAAYFYIDDALVYETDITTYNYFVADVVTANDYSPFGAPLAGRSYTASNTDYRFGGSNGQEKDDEIFKGAYSAEYWEYDSRLGRRWNRDPKPNPSISDYACFSNNPICFIDIKGDTTSLFDKLGNSLGTINDNLKNETHFLNSKADYDKILANNKGKSNNDIANAARGASMAYYDANTESQMKKAFEKSPNNEFAFALVLANSVTKQLSFVKCNTCRIVNGGKGDGFIQGIDLDNFLPEIKSKSFSIFLTGHSHFKNLEKSNPQIPSSPYYNVYQGWGKTVHEVANARDYSMLLKSPHPLMLLSRKGITIYPGYEKGHIMETDEYGYAVPNVGVVKKW